MDKDEVRFKAALKILSEKHPVSKPTLVKWSDDGIVKFRIEKHGMFEYRLYRKAELERVKSLMRDERVIGLPLLDTSLPQRKKRKPK